MFLVNAVQTKMNPGLKMVDQWPPGSISHVSGAELSTSATFSCPSAASLLGAALLMRCFDNQEALVINYAFKICKIHIKSRPMLNRWRSWSWTTLVNAFNLKFCLEPMPELGPASTGRGIDHLHDVHSLSWHSLQYTLNIIIFVIFLKINFNNNQVFLAFTLLLHSETSSWGKRFVKCKELWQWKSL